MNSVNEYWRIYKFSTLQEMEEFEKQLEPVNNVEEPIKDVVVEVKKENRGSKTKDLHKKIKEYLELNPNVKYRDALKDYKNIVKQ